MHHLLIHRLKQIQKLSLQAVLFYDVQQKELTCFEIPMDDGAAMEVPEADADLVRDVGDLGLGQPLLQVDQDRVQRAAVAKLQEHLQKRETFLSETPGYLFNALLFECCAMTSRSVYRE